MKVVIELNEKLVNTLIRKSENMDDVFEVHRIVTEAVQKSSEENFEIGK